MRRSSVLETRCRSVGPSSRSELASLLLYQDWGVKYDGEDCQVKKEKKRLHHGRLELPTTVDFEYVVIAEQKIP